MENVAEIKKVLKQLIEDRLGLNLDNFQQDYENTDFFDLRIGFKARDLLYLYYDVEKNFNIKIPQEEIIKGRFTSISTVTDIILRHHANYCELAGIAGESKPAVK